MGERWRGEEERRREEGRRREGEEKRSSRMSETAYGSTFRHEQRGSGRGFQGAESSGSGEATGVGVWKPPRYLMDLRDYIDYCSDGGGRGPCAFADDHVALYSVHSLYPWSH